MKADRPLDEILNTVPFGLTVDELKQLARNVCPFPLDNEHSCMTCKVAVCRNLKDGVSEWAKCQLETIGELPRKKGGESPKGVIIKEV